jgi:hypothetical protein
MSRGLCSSCYRSAYISIHEGLTTWDELESFRMAVPARAKKQDFEVALSKADRGILLMNKLLINKIERWIQGNKPTRKQILFYLKTLNQTK